MTFESRTWRRPRPDGIGDDFYDHKMWFFINLYDFWIENVRETKAWWNRWWFFWSQDVIFLSIFMIFGSRMWRRPRHDGIGDDFSDHKMWFLINFYDFRIENVTETKVWWNRMIIWRSEKYFLTTMVFFFYQSLWFLNRECYGGQGLMELKMVWRLQKIVVYQNSVVVAVGRLASRHSTWSAVCVCRW